MCSRLPPPQVPGSYGFIAQCNEGRLSKKRPTEFRIDQVAQPFDDAKFNFKKALQKEVLFMFEPAPRRITKPAFQPAAPPRTSPSLVYINVSPIEYGHVLLVSRALGWWASRLLVQVWMRGSAGGPTASRSPQRHSTCLLAAASQHPQLPRLRPFSSPSAGAARAGRPAAAGHPRHPAAGAAVCAGGG